jgi:hypothetical protein
MKIRMLTLSAGPEGVRQQGGVYEVKAAEGKSLAAAGHAEILDTPKKPKKSKADDKSDLLAEDETATVAQPEAAVTRSGRLEGREAQE